MTLRIREFGDLDEVNLYLNGGVRGGTPLKFPLYGLHGLTLIINGTTITFSESTALGIGRGHTAAQLQAQIRSGVGTANVGFLRGALTLALSTPGTVTITKTGTANAILGFGKNADTVGKVVSAPGGAVPSFVSIQPNAARGGYVAVINE